MTRDSASSSEYLQLTVHGVGEEAVSLTLGDRLVRLGRGGRCDVRLNGGDVSRLHAEIIKVEPRAWALIDRSLNGILLNGKEVEGQAVLNTGDVLEIGRYRIHVETASVAATLTNLFIGIHETAENAHDARG